VKRNGLRWRDAPAVYGPHKTLCNRFVRWSRLGVLGRIFRDLAKPGAEGDTIMMDIEPVVRHRFEDCRRGHLKAHRTAASLKKGGPGRGRSAAPRAV
jgi:transposase